MTLSSASTQPAWWRSAGTTGYTWPEVPARKRSGRVFDRVPLRSATCRGTEAARNRPPVSGSWSCRTAGWARTGRRTARRRTVGRAGCSPARRGAAVVCRGTRRARCTWRSRSPPAAASPRVPWTGPARRALGRSCVCSRLGRCNATRHPPGYLDREQRASEALYLYAYMLCYLFFVCVAKQSPDSIDTPKSK